MKRIVILVIILMLITMNFLSMFSENTESAEISHIVDEDESEPITENTLEMPNGGGIFYLGNYSLRKGVRVMEASFNLTGTPNTNGQYPTELRVRVGQPYDGQNEYEFMGTGYGSWGFQDRLADNTTSGRYQFPTPGSADTIEVKLPKSADVTSAQLQISGGLYQISDQNRITSSHSNIREIQDADMDGDDDNDIVAIGDHKVIWYNNTNVPTNWPSNEINLSHNNVYSFRVFDVDNDGDQDVVAVSRAGNPPVGYLVYYRNMDGNGTNWTTIIVNATGHPLYNCYEIDVADLDNDGDGDIVTTNRNWTGSSGIFWFNNTDGNGTSWNKILLSGMAASQFVRIIDVDDDGDNDTVIGRGWPRELCWFENIDGKATSWSPTRILITSFGGGTSIYDMETGDFDKDGDLDLVAATMNDVRWFRQPSNPKNTWSGYTVGTFGNSWNGVGVAVGDLGNPGGEPDGNLDIVVAAYNANDVIWWQNDGTPTSRWESHTINSNHANAMSVVVAEIDGKDFVDVVVGSNSGTTLDDIVWYKLNGSYPSNVRLDIGANSNNDWTGTSSWFNTTATVSNLANTFDTILGAAPAPTPDDYGNEIVSIKLKVITDTIGIVSLQGFDIKYDYTVKVTGHKDRSIAEELNELLSEQAEGNDTIPIIVTSSTGGKLKIDDIYVKYNDYPKSLKIEGYSIQEDSKNETLIDLRNHFIDDFTASSDLTFEVISQTNDTFVLVTLYDDKYVSVDSSQKGPNWYGSTTIIVSAMDEEGLVTKSEPFEVKIEPVNDEPVKGTKTFPDISINEGGKSLGIDLDADTYFADIDSTELYYDFIIDPLDEYSDEELNASIDDETWILSINALGDWVTKTGQPLKLRVFCDDDMDDINQSLAYQDILITVNNLPDDPPVWKEIPTVEMDEDETKYFAFNPISDNLVTDVDTDINDLIFSVYSISVDELKVEIDSDKNIYLTPDPDYFGTVTVELKASDTINSDIQSFEVIINNINDLPTVQLLSPRDGAVIYNETVELKWIGSDIDPGDAANLRYSIYLDTTGGTSLYKDNYQGSSIVIPGLNDKNTYYWQVKPYDPSGGEGVCISEPCPSEFTIDIGIKPHSVLKLPPKEAIINEDSALLKWEGTGEEGYTLTYIIYLSKEPLNEPLDDTDIYATGVADTEYVVTDLEPYETYYWTVIPLTTKATGICDSGYWSFKYDPSVTPYDFRIDAPDRLEIEKGTTTTKTISIINKGANLDYITVTLDAGKITHGVTLQDDGIELEIVKNGTENLILEISAKDIEPGEYEIKILAESAGSGDRQEATITIKVYEEEGDEEATFITKDVMGLPMFVLLIPIIILIIVCFAFFMFWRKKRIEEEKRRVEAELVKPIGATPTLDAADVQYVTGPTGPAVGATGFESPQLPFVTIPGGPAGQGGVTTVQTPYQPGTGVQALPQLPPAQDISGQPTTAAVPGAVPPGVPPEMPQAQPQPPYPGAPAEQPPGAAVQPQVQVPVQTQAPPSGPGVNGTGMPPVQVPYIPTAKREGEQGLETEVPEKAPPQTPVDLQYKAPSSQPEAKGDEPSLEPAELMNQLKTLYIKGEVSEETYISLKKELRDKTSSSEVDDLAKRIISGEISEDEYKQQR
ncbi:MAG: VCBS repeat-containing protein [Thermoplasmata archaeon]|nr:MAG: VCBS repeat-containing protein [Thermoplasmata archaeon]